MHVQKLTQFFSRRKSDAITNSKNRQYIFKMLQNRQRKKKIVSLAYETIRRSTFFGTSTTSMCSTTYRSVLLGIDLSVVSLTKLKSDDLIIIAEKKELLFTILLCVEYQRELQPL